jgi:hypothetical protein
MGSYPPHTPSDRLVQFVSHKILDSHYYPTVLARRPVKARRRTGKEKAQEDDVALFDETATRNRDLVHLNDMYPTIDVAYLRRLLLRSTHSFLYSAISTLLEQSDPSSKIVAPGSRASSKGHSSERPPPPRQYPGRLRQQDLFRTSSYMKATLTLLRHQFPDVWSSVSSLPNASMFR